MRLLLDLGNTRLKWALCDGEHLLTMHAARLDEIQSLPAADSALLATSSAEPQRVQQVQHLLRSAGITTWDRVGPPHNDALLTLAYADPATLGVDRWLAMRAARAVSRDACVVVSVGTALTIDAVDDTGQHLGGTIVAGPSAMRDALVARAAHLHHHQGELSAWASTTADAVHSGPLLACTALIERQYRDFAQSCATAPRLLVTGGGAEVLLPALRLEAENIPDLVLRGMYTLIDTEEEVRRP
ncbi:MAG: type III pantothenate kinase [Pseudomarimonas sp.]